ncbi:cytochrome c oxidase assembly protein COX20, mitochondrial [Tamandua tetradactyla]|uniref:cytochrome c oxidase assembly protein COX20, mitochondrial n=1 Tax=Tamandua tetradactyla TaxID=48850 RepID=UPI004053F59D
MADDARGRVGCAARRRGGSAPAGCTGSAGSWVSRGSARTAGWACALGSSRRLSEALLFPMAAEPETGEPGKGKPFKLLGILDVENIPCARDSILYGSLGSVVTGFGHFLLTSRIRRSCDVGVGGFILVTLGCWFHCRYNNAKLRIKERIAREGIKNKILYESTHLDPERKRTNSNSSS